VQTGESSSFYVHGLTYFGNRIEIIGHMFARTPCSGLGVVLETLVTLAAMAFAALSARWLENYRRVLKMELATIAGACAKSNANHVERKDPAALTIRRRRWQSCRSLVLTGFQG
jgi:hypothetical protein